MLGSPNASRLRGEFDAARVAADDALAKASAGPGLPQQIPLLQRVHGFALFAAVAEPAFS